MRATTVGMLLGVCFSVVACGRTAKQGSNPTVATVEGGQGGGNDAAVAPEGGAPNPFVNGGDGSGGTSFSAGGKPNVICQQGEQHCESLLLYGCNERGTDYVLLADCANVGFCDSEADGGPKCAQIECTPGTSFCNGTKLISCNAKGQYGSKVDPVACPEPPEQLPICSPDSARCREGLLEVCIDPGLAYTAGQPCPSGWHCADLDGYAQCIANACAVGASACLQNQVGSCADDGMSLSSVTLDCSAQGKVCSAAGVCSTSVTDSLGPLATADQDVTNWVELSAMDVHSDRVVTQLAQHLALTSGGTITWLIYEWTAGGYQLLLEESTPVTAGDTMFASQPLAMRLNAGHRYLFGVRVVAQGKFYRQLTFESRKLSFANMLGSTSYDGPDYHALPRTLDFNDYENELRITTAITP